MTDPLEESERAQALDEHVERKRIEDIARSRCLFAIATARHTGPDSGT